VSRRTLALVLLVPFGLLTVYAVMQVGYVGIFDYPRHSPAGWQVFADLVVALVLVMVWMVRDARRLGRNPWPWVVGTLLTGSISPLLYLATSPASTDDA
jgi:drug/metabolite transporter (DMT)-like permease